MRIGLSLSAAAFKFENRNSTNYTPLERAALDQATSMGLSVSSVTRRNDNGDFEMKFDGGYLIYLSITGNWFLEKNHRVILSDRSSKTVLERLKKEL